jgi:hypothetical protein
MRAIEFGDLNEMRARHGVVNASEPLPEGGYTNPSFVMTPHRHAQVAGAGNGQILALPEEG